ncbi:hypothetical protein J2X08_000082 [Rhizobium rosettiformans]|nr:hypothetical protein [Rhizobium rosettiformans]MDR7062604.1 hypothetical protein [Rhizobium rosettiformans]
MEIEPARRSSDLKGNILPPLTQILQFLLERGGAPMRRL